MRIFIILLCSLLFFSCEKSNKGNGMQQVLPLENVTSEDIKNTDIFDVVSCIPLETRLECMLTDISKIEYFQDKYYILDRNVHKAVLVFNEHGTFLRKIGVYGHGHGEYATISDFTIDKEGKRVVILSAPSVVYVYDLNGNFQQSKELSKSTIWNIVNCSEGFIASTNHLTYTEGDDAFLLYGFDKEFNVRYKWEHVFDHQMYSPLLVSSVLQNVSDKTFYFDCYLHRCYEIGRMADGIVKRYQLAFSEPMPASCFELPDKFMDNQLKYDFLMEALICGDKMFVVYIHKGRQYVAVLELDGKVFVNGTYSELIPKVFNGCRNEILYPVTSEEFLSSWKDKLGNDIKPEDNSLILKLVIR